VFRCWKLVVCWLVGGRVGLLIHSSTHSAILSQLLARCNHLATRTVFLFLFFLSLLLVVAALRLSLQLFIATRHRTHNCISHTYCI